MADGLTTLSLAIGCLGVIRASTRGMERLRLEDTGGWELPYSVLSPISLKWDWKRSQTVTVSLTSTMKGLTVRSRLSNDDQLDGDDVCVTLLLRDQSGVTLAVFHENRHSDPGTDTTSSTTLNLSKKVMSAIGSVALGTKQCRGGPNQDDDIYRRTKKTIGQR